MRIYKPLNSQDHNYCICFIICNIKCTTQIKCLYSACGIYRLGEHCKILRKRLQNHVKHSACLTNNTCMHITKPQYQDLKLGTSSFVPIGWFYGLYYWAPMHAHEQAKKAGVECGVCLLRTHHPHLSRLWIPAQWASAESRGGHTQRSTSESSHHTVFFIKAIFQKAERGERTHSSSKPHSGKQLHINRDTVREWRAILGQTWKQTLSEF